jgi:hypothetical protein
MDRSSSLAVVPSACASFTIVDSFTSLAPRSMWPTVKIAQQMAARSPLQLAWLGGCSFWRPGNHADTPRGDNCSSNSAERMDSGRRLGTVVQYAGSAS